MSGDFLDDSDWDEIPVTAPEVFAAEGRPQVAALNLILSDLCEALAAESEALSAGQFDVAKEAANRKAALARLYEQHLAALKQAPGIAAELEPEAKQELKSLLERLRELTVENSRVVGSLLHASQSMVEAIMTVAREEKIVPTYGRRGQLDARGVAPTGTAIAFNGIY